MTGRTSSLARAGFSLALALCVTLAIVAAALAVGLDRDLAAGALAIVAVVAIQRLTARGPVPRPAVLGIRQMAMGFGVVVVTALGVLAASS